MQKFTEIFDGWHAAIYVSDFSGAFRAMEAADLIFTEHGFFDANIDGLRDAQKFHQFRFQVNACNTHLLHNCESASHVCRVRGSKRPSSSLMCLNGRQASWCLAAQHTNLVPMQDDAVRENETCKHENGSGKRLPVRASAIEGSRDLKAGLADRFHCAQDIIALKDLDGDGWSVKKGEVIYQFGNEVRSLCHPKFMRALYNRNGDNFDVPEEVQTIV